MPETDLSAIQKKYDLRILIIGIYYPWLDGETAEMMNGMYFSEDLSDDLGCFEKIYISFSSLNK